MGYTHYWSFSKTKGKAKAIEAKYQQAIKQCQTIVNTYSKANGGLSGYTAHTKPGEYGGINVNGSRENGHENFVMPEHFNDIFKQNTFRLGADFCKTAGKPYDVVVVACLCTLQHYLPENFSCSSDGTSADWNAGLELARRVLKLKIAMPATIRRELAVQRG